MRNKIVCNFSSGDLRLDLEYEIVNYMGAILTWNSVMILLKTELNEKIKSSDFDRATN